MSGTAELISAKDLAKKLNVAVQTLAVWRLRGFGPPHIKAGCRVLYSMSDVARWLESRKRASTSETFPALT